MAPIKTTWEGRVKERVDLLRKQGFSIFFLSFFFFYFLLLKIPFYLGRLPQLFRPSAPQLGSFGHNLSIARLAVVDEVVVAIQTRGFKLMPL